ncbi:DgyrCDS12638 [Dimorphilus gyrociliatus]|uniref:DgyrCDS12638 n=1 Tax=Dimorphilus gyrociliatus TaxID=2664684 RepID=A0A7I8W8M5_9ANNE|nr:DgyrCDS12638 [Dimorphilus gyrociliatus]
MGTSLDAVTLLEQRLDKLESLVLGPKGSGNENSDIIGSVVKSNEKLNLALTGRQKIINLFKQLDDLESYLSLEYSKKALLSNRTKVDIIVAEEELMKQSTENLEKIKDLSKALDSEHIKSVSSLNGKLNQLCVVHLQQKDAANDYSAEVKGLLEHYNNIVSFYHI